MKKSSLTVSVFVGLTIFLGGCSLNSSPQAVGNLVPDFTVVRPEDETKPLNLKDLKGKVVLVDFWATWCGPCRQELPTLQKLWEDNKDKGLELVAISQEPAQKIISFEAETGLKMPFYEDVDGAVDKAFKITGLPTTVLIGKDGRVAYSVMGAGTGVDEELQAAIKKALE